MDIDDSSSATWGVPIALFGYLLPSHFAAESLCCQVTLLPGHFAAKSLAQVP
ncbi:MAG: hypothetical protein MUF72_08750 [Elainella sp. Prado103]|nr:hypothetical protein [Elainella sp. Prado103]